MTKYEKIKIDLEGSNLPERTKLKSGETLINPRKMVNSHIRILDANPGNRVFLNYYKRLEAIHEAVINERD